MVDDELLEARRAAPARRRPRRLRACRRSSSPCTPRSSGPAHSARRLRRAASGSRRGRRGRSARAASTGVVTISVSASIRWNLSLPSAKLGLRRGALAFDPGDRVLHRLHRIVGRGLQRLLVLRRADALPRRHAVARIIIGEAAERRLCIIDEAGRHRRLDIGAHLLGRARDVLEELDVGASAAFLRRVRHGHIDRRIERGRDRTPGCCAAGRRRGRSRTIAPRRRATR